MSGVRIGDSAEPMSAGATLAAQHGLPRLGRRPHLVRYLAMTWQRRHFIWELGRSRFVARAQGDRLGLLWMALRPTLQALVYGAIFVFLLPSSSRPSNYVAFITIGVFVYGYFAAAVSSGARAVIGDTGLIRAMAFPKAVLPISVMVIEGLTMLPVLGVMLLITLVTGEPLKWEWLLIFPAFALMTIFNQGLAFFTARITTQVRDFQQLLPFILRIFFYLSGVFFDLSRYKSHELIYPILAANPVYVFIEIFREALLEDRVPSANLWVKAAIWAVVTLVAGLVFFWHAEERYGRE